jgi:hypothetical protein
MDKAVRVIARCHRELDLPDPSTGAVRRYLGDIRALRGRTVEVHKIDPLTAEHIAGIATLGRAAEPPTVERIQATVDLGRLLRWPVRALAALTVTDVRPKAGRVSVTAADGTVTDLDGVDEETVSRLSRLCETTEPGTSLLAPKGVQHLRARLREAARRAGVATSIDPYPGASWDDDDSWLVTLFLRNDATRQLCKTTSVIVGWALARRAAGLHRFAIDDFEAVDDGWAVTIHESKTDPVGLGIDHHLPHLDPEGPACPACTLETWLWVLERRWGYTAGPLFPAKVYLDERSPTGRVGTPTVRRACRTLHGRVTDGEGGERIGSRSLRVGRADDAHRSGLDLEEIAASVTKHKTETNTALYLRSVGQFRLDV